METSDVWVLERQMQGYSGELLDESPQLSFSHVEGMNSRRQR